MLNPISSTSPLAYTNLESEPNPDHEVRNGNFDQNLILMEFSAYESDDKHTIERLKYHREKEGEIGKEVKATTCRPARITTWTVVGDIK